MGFYERILRARDLAVAGDLFDKFAELERAYAARQGLVSEARQKLDLLEARWAELDPSKAMQPASGATSWKAHPDPDPATMAWFDFVIGAAGAGAVRPLLDRYRSLGWITVDQHGWFYELSRSIVPEMTVPQLPGDAGVLEQVDERTRALLAVLAKRTPS